MAIVIKGDILGGITFRRATGREFPTCEACPDSREFSEKTSMLLIDMEQTNITLCPFHEGMLLEKLLTNYLKRKARDSKAGFVGTLNKEIVVDA